MTRDPHACRPLEGLLRVSRSAVVLVALLALFGLTSIPHHHAGSTEERSCPACQVTRNDGAPPAETALVLLPALEGIVAPEPRVPLDVARLCTHAGPLPSRGPPPVSPAEQL